MGAINAVDINNMTEVNAVAFRVLSNALGDDVTKVFIGQFNNGGGRPRLTASQIADALERGKARAAAMSASVGGGRGDFTKERHDRPEPTFEELTAQLRKVDAEMSAAGKYDE